ncbi:hypothetical protein Taro_015833 [Colocasia esculenta]|uniref:Protein FAR1-RELATED SEQUENCE n=1 Tax=Colocasia esculenta TaxID=4460 RepID=A0A843UII4_COLES|nr:hypothetical protein [Colocasia esculenta]
MGVVGEWCLCGNWRTVRIRLFVPATFLPSCFHVLYFLDVLPLWRITLDHRGVRLVGDRHNQELEANIRMTQNLPYAPPIAIVQHAARVYTPAMFKTFMAEYAVGLECLVKDRQYDGSIYILTVEDSRHNDHLVTINLSQEILSCSCHKFEFAGILCGHVLTCIIHDLRYIPERYILKRWTRGAGGISLNSHAAAPVEDPKLSLPQRYNSLARDFIELSVRAAEDEDMYNCALKHKLAISKFWLGGKFFMAWGFCVKVIDIPWGITR